MKLQPPQNDIAPLCEACGYNLTGLNDDGGVTGKCPECGSAYDLRQCLNDLRRYRREARQWQVRLFLSTIMLSVLMVTGIPVRAGLLVLLLIAISIAVLIILINQSAAAVANARHGQCTKTNRAEWRATFSVFWAILAVGVIGVYVSITVVGMAIMFNLFGWPT